MTFQSDSIATSYKTHGLVKVREYEILLQYLRSDWAFEVLHVWTSRCSCIVSPVRSVVIDLRS